MCDLKRLVKVEIATINGQEARRHDESRESVQTTPRSATPDVKKKRPVSSVQAFDDAAAVVEAKPTPVKKVRPSVKKVEVVSRVDRFEKEKKAKRKHSKNKGKPKSHN
ncbi:hypothetical protein [Weissella soli]|uniref:hypothetical protein n=1 Tax=Weissella soli TaxID=155866 RepID=UPI0035A139E1